MASSTSMRALAALLALSGCAHREQPSSAGAAPAAAPTPARYVRFEIRAANGSPAVTEITVGGRP